MSLKPPPFQSPMFLDGLNFSRPWREWFDSLQKAVNSSESDLEAVSLSVFMQSSLKAQLETIKKETEILFLL